MRLYLAGPMTGMKWYNFPAFDQARFDLEVRGHVIYSPADISREMGFDPLVRWPEGLCDWSQTPDDFILYDVILRDIGVLLKCEGVCMLPGWEDSKGAKAEHAIAIWAKLKRYEIGELI